MLSYNSTHAYVSYLFTDSIHGSDILSHHLTYRDSNQNVWIDVIGQDGSPNLATLQTFAVEKSVHYEVKFRVMNSRGWSDYSPLLSFIAADTPSQPLPLVMVEVTSSYITLDFDL